MGHRNMSTFAPSGGMQSLRMGGILFICHPRSMGTVARSGRFKHCMEREEKKKMKMKMKMKMKRKRKRRKKKKKKEKKKQPTKRVFQIQPKYQYSVRPDDAMSTGATRGHKKTHS